ncbi:KinB-signaling pathway activation protein [Paenibacillus sp. N1-5-1-14]|uniref:KinB-signaling pathway activation protein n=1 Tax=Paenibacillus radicibacter TaxID=2972488 RepID=UPI002158C44B|nr:KinB-signaling pathway activation protein [Paenibacillus radicibacter]MCR8645653.1 KinB-signaling pathway activation protein [Paenibacillus radicibacter]
MLKKWLYVMWTTIVYGLVSGLVLWWILRMTVPNFILFGSGGVAEELKGVSLGLLTASMTSVLGFFAFLMLKYYMIGILKNRIKVWNIMQWYFIILSVLALFYYFIYKEQSGSNDVSLLVLPIVLLVFSIVVAFWKVKLTNKGAMLPTLFFMIVGTALMSLPVFKAEDFYSTFFMMFVLLVCNARQILILHKLVKN